MDNSSGGVPDAQVELKVRSIRCVSRADSLPFELADAMRAEEDLKREDAQYSTVQQDTRLENRWIDLRTPVNQAIFRVQSAVCQVRWQDLVPVLKAMVCHLAMHPLLGRACESCVQYGFSHERVDDL